MNFNEIFNYADGKLFWKINRVKKPAGDEAGWLDKDGYLLVTLPTYIADSKTRVFKAHRVIWEMFNGPIPEDKVIDHIDGNPSNNRLENLRVCSMRENHRNKRAIKNGASPLKGAAKEGNRWRARIRLEDGTRLNLGTYKTQEEAHEVYAEAALKYFGDYARKI